MPRIKIIKTPNKSKLKTYALGGEDDCPQGQTKDEFGNCITDFNYQPEQQKFGTRAGIDRNVAPDITTPAIKNPSNAFAPATSFNTQGPSMQMPQSSGFDIWSNPTNIGGQSANAMNMPQQTVVDAQGKKTTTGSVNIGNPTMYQAQQTPLQPAAPGKRDNSSNNQWKTFRTGIKNTFNNLLDQGAMAVNFLDNRQKQKAYNQKAAAGNLPDNYMALDTTQDRGDYDINDGIFRPDQMGFKSKGMYTNAQVAQQNFVRYGGSMPYAAEGLSVPYVGDIFMPSTYIAAPIGVHPTLPPDAASIPASSSPSRSADSDYALPVNNFKVTSGFGSRNAPLKGASTNHNGLDLAVPLNSDVFSPMNGVVEKIYYNNLGGKQLIIRNADGSRSGFAHLNDYDVSIGDSVKKGQKVALSGNTGNSTGPHLHFTWHDPNGNLVDPRTVFNFESYKKSSSQNSGSENQMSFTHNNPMNVHYGDFAAKYGATPGADDNGGRVAMFPDLATGIQANKDLMFGPAYNNLTISQARNKWVKGNIGTMSSSTPHIVEAMGGDRKLSDLSSAEKDKLFKEFTRWEGKQGYNLVKDKRIFSTGGQNDNTMKIKIVGVPEENEMAYGGQPPYSGQTDYGLYIGQRNLYKTMAKHPYEDVNNTVSQKEETPEDPYVLEAEDGEVISTPNGANKNIVGDRHYEGGEKLTKSQAPEGSFIFSDTKKMRIKDPELLKHFGKGGVKSATPAELAKQYNTNLYRAILADPTTDNLQKNTAKRMLDSLEQHKAELALVQEGMKGFPQGIPDIAKPLMERMEKMKGMAQEQEGAKAENQEDQGMARYGGSYGSGLRKFVGGGDNPSYDPFGVNTMGNIPQTTTQTAVAPAAQPAASNPASNYPWFQPYTKSNTQAGRITRGGKHLSSLYDPSAANQYQDVDYWAKDYKLKTGRDLNNIEDLQSHIYNEVNQNNPDAVKEMWQNYGPTLKSEEQTQQNFADKKAGARTAFLMGQRPEKPTFPWTPPPPGTVDTTTTLRPTTDTTTLKPGDFIPGKTKVPWDYLQQDVNNMGAAAMNLALMKKYHLQSRNIQPNLPEFIPQDWRGMAASMQSGQNSAAQQLATYQPGSATAANLSFLQGQGAPALGNYISGVDAANAQGATTYSGQKADMLNKFTQYNAAKKDSDADYENTADSRYRANLAHGFDRYTGAKNQAITNRANLYAQNISESPDYFYNPRDQRMTFNSQEAMANFKNRNKGGYQNMDSDDEKKYQLAQKYKSAGWSDEAAMQMAGFGKGSQGRQPQNVTYPNAPLKNRQVTYGAPNYGGAGYDYTSAYPNQG